MNAHIFGCMVSARTPCHMNAPLSKPPSLVYDGHRHQVNSCTYMMYEQREHELPRELCMQTQTNPTGHKLCEREKERNKKTTIATRLYSAAHTHTQTHKQFSVYFSLLFWPVLRRNNGSLHGNMHRTDA